MRSRTHALCLLLILVFIALALTAVPAFAATSVFTGTLEGETNPYDDYYVSMTAGATITIDHVCEQDSGTPPAPTTPLDPALQVLNSSGTELVADDDSGTIRCAQSRSSRIVFTATAAGIYIIRATSYEIRFNGNDTTDPNADGNYVLTIDGDFTLPSVVIYTGMLEGETNPYDDYFVSMTAGATITIDHVCEQDGGTPPAPTTPLDPALQVLNSSGTELVADDDSGTIRCAQSRSSRIVFTATAAGIYIIRATSYEIRFNSNDTTDPNADGNYILTISGSFTVTTVPPTITSPASASVVANTAFSHTFLASGSPSPILSYSAESLPPGVTRTGSILSGTPTAVGIYTIDVTASNGVTPNATQTFTITVTGTAPAITSAASASVLATTTFNHTFTATGNPSPNLTYSAENLPPGVTRTGDTLSGTPTTPGSYGITVTASNGVSPDTVQNFTITVTGSAPAITSAVMASVAANDAFSHTFTATGAPAPTLSYTNENLPPGVNRTGDTLSGIPIAVGTYTIDVTASNGIAPDAVQTFTIIVTGDAPAITSTPSATVVANTAFTHTFTVAGNPVPVLSYANENLPPSVTRTGDTLSGTPTAVGVYSIDVTASNGVSPDAVQIFIITVTGDAPIITSPASALAVANIPFSHPFTVVGNPVPALSYANENLPPGVTRTGDTLSGTPTAVGVYSIDVTASNGVTPDAMQTLTIIVTGDAPIITSAASAIIEEQSPFLYTFTAIGNPVPVLTYSNENLPPGVIRSGDTLSGTPTLSGTYSITVTASNGVAPDAVQTFILTVGAIPVPPPSPYAEDMNFAESDTVRTGIPETLVDSINVRVLYQNGQPVNWLGGDLYNAGAIGNQGVLDMGVQQAIDIFSPNGLNYFNGGAVFCLRGEGTLIWLAAKNAPRIAEIIGSYEVDDFPGYTCTTLFEPGTLVLVGVGNRATE